MAGPIRVGACSVGGRGVFSTASVGAGDQVLRLPLRLLLTAGAVRQRDARVDAALAPLGLDGASQLAVALLHERRKGEASFWSPYLRVLPEQYDTLCLWSPDDAQQLQLPHAVRAAELARQSCLQRWRHALPALTALGLDGSQEDWQWACATISSRTVHTPADGGGGLAPLGDLFNFCEIPAAAGGAAAAEQEGEKEGAAPGEEGRVAAARKLADGWAGDGGVEADSYVFRAWRSYSAGEQILLCYGALSQIALLEHYGFALPRNAHDRVPVPPEALHPGGGGQHGGGEETELYLGADGMPSWRLLAALRLAALPSGERKQHGHTAAGGGAVSAQNEAIALGRLLKLAEALLAGLPTRAAQDEAATKQPGLSDRMRLALVYRLGQKRIIEACACWCGARIAQLRAQLASSSGPVLVHPRGGGARRLR